MHPLTYQLNSSTYKLHDIKQLLAQQQRKKSQLGRPEAFADVTNEIPTQSHEDLPSIRAKNDFLMRAKAKFLASDKSGNLNTSDLARNFLGHQAYNHMKSNLAAIKRPKDDKASEFEGTRYSKRLSRENENSMIIEKTNKDELKMCPSDAESNCNSRNDISYIHFRNQKSPRNSVKDRFSSNILRKELSHANRSMPIGALPALISNGSSPENTKRNRSEFKILVESTLSQFQEQSNPKENRPQRTEQIGSENVEPKGSPYFKKQSIIKKDRSLYPLKSLKSVKFSEHFENSGHLSKNGQPGQTKYARKVNKKACCSIF